MTTVAKAGSRAVLEALGHGAEDQNGWPLAAIQVGELTDALKPCLDASSADPGNAWFDIRRLPASGTGTSFVVECASASLAIAASGALADAGYRVHHDGLVIAALLDGPSINCRTACTIEAAADGGYSIVLAAKDDKQKSKTPKQKVSDAKEKATDSLMKDMEILKDGWSVKTAQRLFQHYVGAGDKFSSFGRFLAELDDLLAKFKKSGSYGSDEDDDIEVDEGKKKSKGGATYKRGSSDVSTASVIDAGDNAPVAVRITKEAAGA